jgi:HEPN domain-containing protein
MKRTDRRVPTPEAKSLLEAAIRDYKTFYILYDAPNAPTESLCFHAQQMIEKTIKAVLVSYGVQFRRTHDLVELAELLRSNNLSLPTTLSELQSLNPFAVLLRYEYVPVQYPNRDRVHTLVEAVIQWAADMLEAPWQERDTGP